eukprot:CAMPEP_0172152176 /NCGR_PEP_ID=MMETSP1050-20130122/681_1 /TAXON_ID=233186 /ORGANISM="Cryptomonas curvata, Strain CCAP979/52" /LENGTH=453 /DNA_ID=CAMNT_0012820447 /DNA_START=26 /DNA_END=1384 /DNA_ORIENTATION=-
MPRSREEFEQKQAEKKQRREQRRASVRVSTIRESENLNALEMAQAEVQALNNYQAGLDDGEAEEDPILKCIQWLLKPPKHPPKPWETYRRDEIVSYIEDTRKGLVCISFLVPESLLYWMQRRRRLKYFGEKNSKGLRDGRGIAFWPDPPFGGGESYFGLWRDHEPHGHGMFRWFDGDMYFGEWSGGLFEGYGVYQYGPLGAYAYDSYNGAYYQGMRQGTGIYTFSGKNEADLQRHRGSGVYIGEWLKGMMHGLGLLNYEDGEYYIGTWKLDKKDGIGVYMWGASSQVSAGDKYEGQFRNGLPHGSGRTLYADGGWHKGLYVAGKMHGLGMMQTAEGWEYIGSWQRDQLHGEAVCYLIYAQHAGNSIWFTVFLDPLCFSPTIYSLKDWRDIESVGMDEARNADTWANHASDNCSNCTRIARLAKESQQLARDQQDEALYWAKQAIDFKKYLQAW